MPEPARGAGETVLSPPELVLMAHRGLQDTPREARAAASRRYAAYVIEAFRAPEAVTPLPPAARLAGPLTRTTQR
ncbi:hypothetical protein [Streptomyces albogriseolus]|uniref:hypothetical protein n=1 Tax=Streptomyces albogriseolus TaxID=1887 RepID=UPI00367E0282